MRLKNFISDIARRYPLPLAINTLLLLLGTLSDALTIFLIAPVIDIMVNPDPSKMSGVTLKLMHALTGLGLPFSLTSVLAIFIGCNLIKALFQTVAWNMIFRTKYAVMRDLTVGTFEDFFNARWRFFTDNEQGTLLNTFMRELVNVGNAFTTIAHFLTTLLQLALYLIVPLYISWQVTTESMLAALALALPFLLLGRYSYTLGARNTTSGNRISAILQESLGLAKVILGYGNQGKSSHALGSAYDEFVRSCVKSETLNTATPLLYQPFGFLVVAFALLAARKMSVPLSETAVLFYALLKLVPVIASITEKKNALDSYLPSYEQLTRLREKARELRHRCGTRPFTGFTKEIRYETVSFSHPGREPVLEGISLSIPKGTMAAFVGESGAGKSTLIDLLIGFHEPQSGRITFDGVPLADFDVLSYRRRLGYVSQESLLFNLSIRDNLLWAKEDATENELLHACRQANAEEFVLALAQGLDTVIGDRGVRLSGGQIQRLALARAILRRPDLLILDEATSSLDTESERLIQQAVENISKETTTLVIAHRLSTVVNADMIYVLKKGRIVEQGSYQDLLAGGGVFTRMAGLQELSSDRLKKT